MLIRGLRIANTRMTDKFMEKLIYGDITYKLNGILFTVHNELGKYCNEKQYSDAIETRLKDAGLSYQRELVLPPSFTGEMHGRNKIDFLIEDKIILEVKARNMVGRREYYQVRRYLDAFGRKLGLLVNFRDNDLRIKRILNANVKE